MSLLLVDSKFVSESCEKANIFNKFFASIGTLINNASFLPSFTVFYIEQAARFILFVLLKVIH